MILIWSLDSDRHENHCLILIRSFIADFYLLKLCLMPMVSARSSWRLNVWMLVFLHNISAKINLKVWMLFSAKSILKSEGYSPWNLDKIDLECLDVFLYEISTKKLIGSCMLFLYEISANLIQSFNALLLWKINLEFW